MSTEDQGESRLAAVDYVVFALTLTVSAAIGVFFAIRGWSRSADTEDYLLGGRNLKTIPVALSLSVSFMSAITVLGTPADIYLYGTMYWWFLLSMLVVCLITAEVFIPTFYNMRISSTYEYLEKRFDKKVRMAGTLTYIVQTIFYVGIVIYAPSLALNAVTGINLWMSVMTTGIVCIFYTALGGIKAVVWTDVFQATVMLLGFLIITIKGSMDVGGISEVWRICYENQRIDFVHFEFDPRIRHTFWSVLIGGTFLWLAIYAVSQSQVQRYLCCKSVKDAKRALYVNWVGLVVIISFSCLNGAIMYAYFHKCDPFTTGKVHASDQLLPYLSLHIFKDLPGLTGIVISCVFSGSLSTVSSGINAMTCVTTEDILKPYLNCSERTLSIISKLSVVVYGGLCIGMAYVASQLGEVLEAALSILGLVGGPVLGMFTLGLFFPFANTPGALVGLLSGLVTSVSIYIGKVIYPPSAEFKRRLPLSCDVDSTFPMVPTNASTASPLMTSAADAASEGAGGLTAAGDEYPAIADLFAISYAYYSFVGFLACLIVGLAVSLLTGGWKNRKNVGSRLLYSAVRSHDSEEIPEENLVVRKQNDGEL